MGKSNPWPDMSREEKREERFRHGLSPDIKFSSPAAGEAYRRRVARFIRAIKLEKPDRVPVMLPVEYYPAYYAGGKLKKVMYDYDELRRAGGGYILSAAVHMDRGNPDNLRAMMEAAKEYGVYRS